MIKKTVLSGMIAIGMAVGFSGCNEINPPEKIELYSKSAMELDDKERALVFEMAFNDSVRNSGLNIYQVSNYGNGCLLTNPSHRKEYGFSRRFCFTANKNGGIDTVTTYADGKDKGKEATWHQSTKRSIAEINNFQRYFAKRYSQISDKYVELKSIVKNAKIVIEDASGTLDKDTLDPSKVHLSIVRSKNQNDTFEIVDDFSLKAKDSRIFYTVRRGYVYQASAYVLAISAKAHYVPDSYVLENNSIIVEANRYDIKITNKTKNFINIESISMYYNGHIDTIKDADLKLSPQGTVTQKLSKFETFGSKKVIEFDSTAQKVDYGFALSLYNQDINKRDTLFKKDDFSLDGLLSGGAK